MSATSSVYWWLRLAVAAFVLSAWVIVGLGGGIARADDPPSSDGTSTSETSPGPKHTPPKASKPDRPKHSAKADQPDSTSDATTESSSQTDEDTDPADTTEATSEPDDPPQPQTRHSSRRFSSTPPSIKLVKPAKPVADDPKPARVADQPEPKAKLAAIEPAVPSTQSSTPTIRVPQTREVVGLVSDVGVVAMSAVWTAADTVAQIFGPHSFFGAPYALASAVANSAAAVSRTLIGAPPGSVSTGPFPVTYGILHGLSFFNPQKPPPGANDPSITVSPEHPLPIILLNGTTTTHGINWSVGAPVLANAGYKVYTFNYGNVGQDPITRSRPRMTSGSRASSLPPKWTGCSPKRGHRR